MISTGDYSIDEIKSLFVFDRFTVGSIITTTLNQPNGSYMILDYEFTRVERSGFVCRLLHQYGNFDGKYTSSRFDKVQLMRFIHQDYKYLFKVKQ